jgi:hypothetical protein
MTDATTPAFALIPLVNFGDQRDVETGHLLEGRCRVLNVLAVFQTYDSFISPARAEIHFANLKRFPSHLNLRGFPNG